MKINQSIMKMNLIKEVEKSLSEAGLSQQDYVISLQGPTLIFAKSGKEKFDNDIILRAEILDLGILIL
jgi:hypothetical protein